MRFSGIVIITALLLVLQGCGGGPRLARSPDLRTTGTQMDDETIESKAMARINEKYKDNSKVSVTSFNHFALITGDAMTEEVKTDIERIVRTVPSVEKTANEVSVGALSPVASRRSDATITKEIKSKISKSNTVKTVSFQVTTAKGIVYLLGLVTHADATAIAKVASETPNVKKVVLAFQYID